MSADRQAIMVRASYPICLAETLSEIEQQSIMQLLGLLPTDNNNEINLNDIKDLSKPVLNIKSLVDGRGLACPMPLLKTNVALRNVAIGESLYVVATDPNSQADITAFCQQSLRTEALNPLLLMINQATVLANEGAVASKSKYSVDTIYHFIITKTDSN